MVTFYAAKIINFPFIAFQELIFFSFLERYKRIFCKKSRLIKNPQKNILQFRKISVPLRTKIFQLKTTHK